MSRSVVISNRRSASVKGKGLRRRWLKADFVVDCISEPLLAAEITFRCLNADMTEQELNLFKLSARLVIQTGAGTAKVMRRKPIHTAFENPAFTTPQITFGLNPLVPIRLALLIARKIGPVEIPAAVNQWSTATLTQVGTGTGRT
jgi:hypothetical protein